MELVLDVEADGETRQVEIDLTLSEEEFLMVSDLCGGEALVSLATGEWSEPAARAILFVRLQPDCSFDDFVVDWPNDLKTLNVAFEAGIEMEIIE